MNSKKLTFFFLFLAIQAVFPVQAGEISPLLNHFRNNLKSKGITRSTASVRQASKFSTPFIRIDDAGYIQTHIWTTKLTQKNRDALAAAGVLLGLHNPKIGVVQAKIPMDQVDAVAGMPFIERITPPKYGHTRVGSENTEGDAILNANDLRALGYQGYGAKVGVISDGGDHIATSAALGDLPSASEITYFDQCGSPASACTGGDEGTAMLEIVHDLAPLATLGLGALDDDLDFIQRVTDLKDTFGADIIVDDIGFYVEPWFEDGNVALAVKDAVDAGVIYVSAAGNDADVHYDAAFTGIASPVPGLVPGSVHDFGAAAGGASDYRWDITVCANCYIAFLMQWAEEFGASTSDYNMYFLNSASTSILGSSFQILSSNDPIEAVEFQAGGSAVSVRFVVEKASGTDRQFKLIIFTDVPSGNITLNNDYRVAARSIYGHPAITGALAVGAIDAATPTTIENYSSQGPVNIFIPSTEVRPKPDLSAIDGVSVTGVGGFPSPFYGTSASAPHVAGVAALLRGGISNDNADIITKLTTTAVDLGTAGFDSIYGNGRVDAMLASAPLLAGNMDPDGTIDSPASATSINAGELVNFQGSCSDPDSTAGPMTFNWDFDGNATPATSALEDPGDVTFPSGGTYTVTFRCTDGAGMTDAAPPTQVITVIGPTPTPTPTPTETPTPDPTPTETPDPTDPTTNAATSTGCTVPASGLWALLMPLTGLLFRRRRT